MPQYLSSSAFTCCAGTPPHLGADDDVDPLSDQSPAATTTSDVTDSPSRYYACDTTFANLLCEGSSLSKQDILHSGPLVVAGSASAGRLHPASVSQGVWLSMCTCAKWLSTACVWKRRPWLTARVGAFQGRVRSMPFAIKLALVASSCGQVRAWSHTQCSGSRNSLAIHNLQQSMDAAWRALALR
jgi:hypothetical protein